MELAVCVPILFMVIFGSIEACNFTFLRQKLMEAAYEGAMLGSQPDASESEIEQHVETTLTARNVSGVTVSVIVNGSGYDSLQAGKLFTVRVSANVSGNLVGPTLFANFASVQAEAAGHKQ